MLHPHLEMLQHELLGQQRTRLPRIGGREEFQLQLLRSRGGSRNIPIKRFDSVQKRSSGLLAKGAVDSVAHAHARDAKVERHRLGPGLSTLRGRRLVATSQQKKQRKEKK